MQPLLFKMLLKEQMYTNKRRLYYHGKIAGYDDSKRNFNEIYLTTRMTYAMAYAGRGGSVETYTLNDTANIFNMKCATDEAAFRKHCQANAPALLKYADKLKNHDWAFLEGDYFRQAIIDVIKDLGYDGYFNYEIDEDGLAILHDMADCYTFNCNLHSPAIALFNRSKAIKHDEVSCTDLSDKAAETEWVKSSYIRATTFHNGYFDMKAFIERMKAQTFGLSENDIQDAVDAITDDDIAEATKMYEGYARSLKKRFGNLHYIES
jgi:hypothetical protein